MIVIRNHKALLLSAILLFLPLVAFAANGCRVIEYPDRYEAVCDGSPAYKPEQTEQTYSGPARPNGAEVSSRRQRIEDIRLLNTHRTETVEVQTVPDPNEKQK
jgi:hypothetical protein